MNLQTSFSHTHRPIATSAIESAKDSPCPQTLRQKVVAIAKACLQILGTVAGFVLNPSLFALGFLFSVAMPEKIGELLHRIEGIYNTYKWQSGACGVVACFFAPHVTLGLSSCLLGSFLGYKLMEHSGEVGRIRKRRQEEALETARPTIDYFFRRLENQNSKGLHSASATY